MRLSTKAWEALTPPFKMKALLAGLAPNYLAL
jgi:hypothetical protein